MLARLRAIITRRGARLAVLITAASLSASGCGGGGAAVAESAKATDDARMIAEQVTPLIEQLVREEYGYGFANKTVVFHDGGANGVSAQFEMYDSGHVVVVLSNYDHPAVKPVVERLREVILQQRAS
jgi:hypothetical protein